MPSIVKPSKFLARKAGGNDMVIDAKLSEGYVVLCDNHPEMHSFLISSFGLSVECPHCGSTQLTTDLVTDFYLSDRDAA